MRTAMSLLLLSLAALSVLASVSGEGAGDKIVFYEPFDEPFEGRWTHSEDPSYGGRFTHQKSEGTEDLGLFIPEKAKKYGIVTMLKEAVDLRQGTVVLQYEVRVQKGFDCGGAYLKFLMPQGEGWTAGQFKDSSPYSIMFGPDKCGATNKVHFIFRHKSPKTGEHIEHHLANPPMPRTEWATHVYTAIINHANNSVKIIVDDTERAFGDFMSDTDFTPPVLPPKTIPDPDDKKPEDWDERAKIPDPDAKKPDEWDEDAPREIPDEDAKKPEGWLDDEPLEVDDPEASKPEDWDNEEDGEWEPPRVANPKCKEGPGCGEWKRPMKKNPAYKGKWRAPMIDNPAYKGVWKPKDIPNPDYYELQRPNLEPIAGIGIEIWTMTDEVIFDNILITTDEAIAEEYRVKKWKPKFDAEMELQKAKRKKDEDEKKATEKKITFKDKVFARLYMIADAPLLKPISTQLKDLLTKGEDYPYVTYAVLILLFFVPVFLLYNVLPAKKPKKKKVTVEQAKKEDISTPDDAPKESGEEKEGEPTGVTAKESVEESEPVEAEGEKVRRRTRRDT